MNISLKTAIQMLCSVSLSLAMAACRSNWEYHSTAVTDAEDSRTITDTTMSVDADMVRMPYNRLIDPAGTVIRFGNGQLDGGGFYRSFIFSSASSHALDGISQRPEQGLKSNAGLKQRLGV